MMICFVTCIYVMAQAGVVVFINGTSWGYCIYVIAQAGVVVFM